MTAWSWWHAPADRYALLDAVIRGDRSDFLVSKWDLFTGWHFRGDAGLLVAMFPLPPDEAQKTPGANGPVVLYSLTAPK